MLRFIVGAGLLLALALPAGAAEFTGKVASVVDGDTIHVLRDGKDVTVQLWGVDAPEAAQPYSDKSKTWVADRLAGKTVRVVEKDKDRFGRLVGQVFLEGNDISAELVRAGGAWAYVRFSKDYVSQEKMAREAKRGLWALPNPQAPWDWRRENPRRTDTNQ